MVVYRKYFILKTVWYLLTTLEMAVRRAAAVVVVVNLIKVMSWNKKLCPIKIWNVIFATSVYEQQCFLTTRSRSCQTLFFFVFLYLLLNLSVCNKWKRCICYEMAKRNSEKWKKYAFMNKKKFGRIHSMTCPGTGT